MCLSIETQGGVVNAEKYREGALAALKMFRVEGRKPIKSGVNHVELPATYNEATSELVIAPNDKPQHVDINVRVFGEKYANRRTKQPWLWLRYVASPKHKLGYHAYLLPYEALFLFLNRKHWIAPIVFTKNDIQAVDSRSIVVKQFGIPSPIVAEDLYREAFTYAFYGQKKTPHEIEVAVNNLMDESRYFWKKLMAFYKKSDKPVSPDSTSRRG